MAIEIVRLDGRRGEVVGNVGVRDATGHHHMIGDPQLLRQATELVVVDLADHQHTNVGEPVDDPRQRLDQRHAAPNRDDMAERQDDRAIAEIELPAHSFAVAGAELIDA